MSMQKKVVKGELKILLDTLPVDILLSLDI